MQSVLHFSAPLTRLTDLASGDCRAAHLGTAFGCGSDAGALWTPAPTSRRTRAFDSRQCSRPLWHALVLRRAACQPAACRMVAVSSEAQWTSHAQRRHRPLWLQKAGATPM